MKNHFLPHPLPRVLPFGEAPSALGLSSGPADPPFPLGASRKPHAQSLCGGRGYFQPASQWGPPSETQAWGRDTPRREPPPSSFN